MFESFPRESEESGGWKASLEVVGLKEDQLQQVVQGLVQSGFRGEADKHICVIVDMCYQCRTVLYNGSEKI